MIRLTYVGPLWEGRAHIEVLVLAFGAGLLGLFAGASVPNRKRLSEVAIVLIPLVICSWVTTFIVPSSLIPDVIVFYLMLGLLVTTYLPLALIFWVASKLPRDQGRGHAGASEPLELERGIAAKSPTHAALMVRRI